MNTCGVRALASSDHVIGAGFDHATPGLGARLVRPPSGVRAGVEEDAMLAEVAKAKHKPRES